MRVGLIARADNGGLGTLTWEFARHMDVDKTVIMDLSALTGYENFPDRYPSAKIVTYADWLSEPALLREFLTDLDVVFTAETPYNFDLYRIAREMGVKTVQNSNFEFLEWFADPTLPFPDALWMCSPWLMDRVPSDWPVDLKYVPTPVSRDRCVFRHREQARRFLHIHGHETILDRNGTQAFVNAIPQVFGEGLEFVLMAQHDPKVRLPDDPRLRVEQTDVRYYWDMYSSGDVLVAPRRYGGQSLQMQEALSCGLPVITTNIAPQNTWLPPTWLVTAHFDQTFMAKTPIPCWSANETDLADTLQHFADSPKLMAASSLEADELAEDLSWDIWMERYQQLLEETCSH